MAPNRLESENNEDENTSYKLHYNYILNCIIDIECGSFDSSYRITVPLLTLEFIRIIKLDLQSVGSSPDLTYTDYVLKML